MDIQKEIELHKEWYRNDDPVAFSWIEHGSHEYVQDFAQSEKSWLAAKAQAVPKGFGDIQSWIAVNSFSALDAVHENVPIIDANELAKYIDNLIEAQEQK